ncbi:hypothetical protein TMU01_26500 [Tenuibacillus multivorans]|uniref:Uncharacterized protein n=1 Tax=Tenuibacillus multivorans TaxID=237069 RepID=A0A1G9WV56_9BACI|nr:hypothetical protein TMU01_26500 [Tenuibacillus multivorans]SDM88279.1 hypothetical protein SAMN05216498_0901 [Tenuibacillus multivorans]
MFLGLSIIIIGLAGYLVVEANSSDGEFVSMSHAGAQDELFDEHDRVYIGKKLKWTGDELPEINDIRIITDQGQVLSADHSDINIQTYVDETNQTNVIYKYSEENRQIIDSYKSMQNYQLKAPYITLVFEVQLLNSKYQYDLETFEIDYELEGQTEAQQLVLENFIFHR